VDRFTSDQDQNDYRSIIHISWNTFHQQYCFVFVIFGFNYPGGPHVAAASWPCTYTRLVASPARRPSAESIADSTYEQ